jgi:hypothetical protein
MQKMIPATLTFKINSLIDIESPPTTSKQGNLYSCLSLQNIVKVAKPSTLETGHSGSYSISTLPSPEQCRQLVSGA